MKTILRPEQLNNNTPKIATIGMFDGVHLGHQKLLSYLVEEAQKTQQESIVFSFDQHPRIVLYDDGNLRLLNTVEEKKQKLQQCGIDYYVPLPFTSGFAKLSAFEFVRDVLINQFQIDVLMVGHDHHFGRNREGNYEQLLEFTEIFNFEVKQFPAISLGDQTISSTKIRKALQEGKIDLAEAMLGYEYPLAGEVVQGKKIGTELGFPTANLSVNPYKLIPKDAVYIVEAEHDNQFYEAMLHIGNQPSFNGDKKQIEVHLLDFDQDVYGETITVCFKKRLRENIFFPEKEKLIKQLNLDKEATRKYFESYD